MYVRTAVPLALPVGYAGCTCGGAGTEMDLFVEMYIARLRVDWRVSRCSC